MAQLEVAADGRFIVDGEEVHGGDVLEIALAGDTWVPVRFEWEHVKGGRPRGYLVLALDGGHEAMLHAPVGALVRWDDRLFR
jgi:hypothetical protein